MTAQQLLERLRDVLEKKPELADRPVFIELQRPGMTGFITEGLTGTDPIFEFSFSATGEVQHVSYEASLEWDGKYQRESWEIPDGSPIEHFGLSNRFQSDPE
jgi:hypothetical protein